MRMIVAAMIVVISMGSCDAMSDIDVGTPAMATEASLTAFSDNPVHGTLEPEHPRPQKIWEDHSIPLNEARVFAFSHLADKAQHERKLQQEVSPATFFNSFSTYNNKEVTLSQNQTQGFYKHRDEAQCISFEDSPRFPSGTTLDATPWALPAICKMAVTYSKYTRRRTRRQN